MSSKSLFYRIKTLFLTSAIAAATLKGCTYGPPPPSTMYGPPRTPVKQSNIKTNTSEKPEIVVKSSSEINDITNPEQTNGES